VKIELKCSCGCEIAADGDLVEVRAITKIWSGEHVSCWDHQGTFVGAPAPEYISPEKEKAADEARDKTGACMTLDQRIKDEVDATVSADPADNKGNIGTEIMVKGSRVKVFDDEDGLLVRFGNRRGDSSFVHVHPDSVTYSQEDIDRFRRQTVMDKRGEN
jgi:hypothetical protein